MVVMSVTCSFNSIWSKIMSGDNKVKPPKTDSVR